MTTTPDSDTIAPPTNPANPYAHQVPYDQHVWFPSMGSSYVDLSGLADDHHAIEQYLYRVVPEVRLYQHGRAHRLIVEERLTERLPAALIERAVGECRAVGVEPTKENVLLVGTHRVEKIRTTLGTSHSNPPDHIHRMQHADWYCGDFYSANMLLSSLHEVGLDIEPEKNYLDFGCSSGSLIRAMVPYEPRADWHGVDPIASAITWAQENIPQASFHNSNVMPPLHHGTGTLDGVTAVSIWSHLGEQRAVAWFEEMARCVKSGGWLAFTTHGWTAIDYYNRGQIKPTTRLKAITEALSNSSFVFEEVYLGASPEGLSADGYGNTYFTREWVLGKLSHLWWLDRFDPGQNQTNQDVYILRRK